MKIEEYLRKYDVVYFVIDNIQTKNRGYGNFKAEYCTIDNTNTKGINWINWSEKYCWQNTTRLYAYFCYYISKVCAEHGYNIYKGELGGDSIDWKRFEVFFPVGEIWNRAKNRFTENKRPDRKCIELFKLGAKPKGAENLEKIIDKTLQKFFTKRG